MKSLYLILLVGIVAPLLSFSIVEDVPVEKVTLEQLFSDKEKYDGKVIEVTGKCVKINKAIMGRNWVHLQDGTGGDEPHDLTVTTSAEVPVGKEVTMRGTITLNKDFGAGYKYDIIMEKAEVL